MTDNHANHANWEGGLENYLIRAGCGISVSRSNTPNLCRRLVIPHADVLRRYVRLDRTFQFLQFDSICVPKESDTAKQSDNFRQYGSLP